MARSITLTVTDSGTIKLPASLRRKLPAGSKLSARWNNGTLMVETKPASAAETREESLSKFDEGLRLLRKWAKENNITAADLKRTQQRLRREKRGQVASRSR